MPLVVSNENTSQNESDGGAGLLAIFRGNGSATTNGDGILLKELDEDNYQLYSWKHDNSGFGQITLGGYHTHYAGVVILGDGRLVLSPPEAAANPIYFTPDDILQPSSIEREHLVITGGITIGQRFGTRHAIG